MASPQAREFPVAPLQPMVWPIAILLTIVLPLAITAAVVFGSQQRPLPGAAMATLLGVLLLTALVLAMLGRRRITLENGMLVVAAAFYTRKAPVASLDLAHARIASLDERTEFRPGLKTNGYGLPGFQAGHFRLRNRAKAFCLLTGQQRVLILPQQDGAFLLLSPEQPQALLDALRAA
ncbi:PH domain-containing protein [Thermomonas aquatica]|uniref:Bacterial Pleckstrin homology domain-containing protein n=1 Tax=Thermomonas aquatica TaxID=2202149 RepID=A0A5B7ZS64_9GAMM|nr:PH domain-containing protein [Thermomonas aquatica]QDA58004.1 hypothetical protein FHQ07_12135 [Thermomonas aquatica]